MIGRGIRQAAGVVAMGVGVAAAACAADRPNILLVLADDLGYSDLGCYGGEIRTPNIDSLAKRGARFTQFYTSARCCPTRASLMTGLYPSQAGIGDFTTARPSPTRGPGYLGRLTDRCATLAEVLKPTGYGCYYVGKWHMHEQTGPIERGFDEFYGFTRDHSHDQYDADYYIRLPQGRAKEIDPPKESYYATDVFSDYAMEFLRQGQRSGKPWFLFLGYSSPHFPIQAPADRADPYEATYRRGWDVLREERFRRMREIGLIDGPRWTLTPRSIVPVDRDDIANGFSGLPNPAWDTIDEARRFDLARRMAVFAAMVEGVDRGVGRLVEALRASGELDNTLILFLSDNGACYEWGPWGFDGESRQGTTTLHTGDALRSIGGHGTHHSYGSGWANLGNTPFQMYKHFTHEGGLGSPLIVHWPAGIGSPDCWIREPTHVMDVMPTLAEVAGATYPATLHGVAIPPMEGRSLIPAIRGAPRPERTIGFDHQGAHALRKGDWKIVWSKRMPHEIQWELYNLAQDRCETVDLAAKDPERVQAMSTEWEEWARRVQVIWEAPAAAPAPTVKAGDESPAIANQPLALTARVNASHPHGVVLAQGGRENGYALHFIDGVPAFDVRVGGKVTRVKGPHDLSGEMTLAASLTAERMTLSVDGRPVGEAKSPGLIPAQPKDGLSVGRDLLSAAGDYDPPNPFNGEVRSHEVRTVVPAPASPAASGGPTASPPPARRATVEAGLRSHDRALLVKEGWIRDPYIVSAPDGAYYLTGTTQSPEAETAAAAVYNVGLGTTSLVGSKARVWRSRNLIDWEDLGTPFTLKDGIWFQEKPAAFAREPETEWRLWAPELHWLGSRWALVHTSPSPVKGANLSLSAGPEVQGPWTNPMGAAIGLRHDPSLFHDDDGTWWMIWGATEIAPLKPDFTGFTADPIRIGPSGATAKMGHEGCLMRKIRGKYVLFGTGWSTGAMRKGSYNLYYAVADRIAGPYGERQFAGRFLGHGTPFQDREGRWWCTAFFNGNVPPLSRAEARGRDLSADAFSINPQGTTIVPLEVGVAADGTVRIRATDPDYAVPGPDEAQDFGGRP